MTTTAPTQGIVPVSGTTPLPPSSSGSSSSGSTSSLNGTTGATLAGNFQTFLTLLTTQLQHQDPTTPLDTNQFTQQLVQFASVEQQLKTNDELTTLVSLQQTAQSTQALTFVGKTAAVDGATSALSQGQAGWKLSVPTNSTVSISIANSTGQTVFTGNVPVSAGDSQPFTWNGRGNDGTQQPDGKYKLTATAADSSGNSVAVSTQIEGVVSSVDLTQTPPLLSIDGQTFTVNQVRSISN